MRRRGFCSASMAALASMGLGCAPSSLGKNEASLWFSYGGKNRKVLLALIDKFHQAQSQYHIKATFQGDYFEGLVKLRTGMYVGDAPTISHVVGEVIPYLSDAGVLSPVIDIGADLVADLAPALSQAGTFVGGADQPLVALPFNRSTPVAYYNKTLFDKLGHKPPEDWRQLRAVAIALGQSNGKNITRWGFECPIDWWFWVALVGQAGGTVMTSDSNIELGGDAGVAALELWQTMVHKERSMKPPPGRDFNAWQATNSDFLAGRVAMIWTSTAFLRYLEDNASFEVATAPLPKGIRRSVPTGGTFFVMPKGRPDGERAAGIAFLRFMMQPEQANSWAQQTGYMPVNQRGFEQLRASGFYKKHPNDAVTLKQLDYAQPWPWAPKLFRVQREAVQPRLEAAVLDRRDPAAVLQEARQSLSA